MAQISIILLIKNGRNLTLGQWKQFKKGITNSANLEWPPTAGGPYIDDVDLETGDPLFSKEFSLLIIKVVMNLRDKTLLNRI